MPPISSLSESQQLLACLLLSAFGAISSLIIDSKSHIGPMTALRNVLGGTVAGLLVFFLTIEIQSLRNSHRLFLALSCGMAWQPVIKFFRRIAPGMLSKLAPPTPPVDQKKNQVSTYEEWK